MCVLVQRFRDTIDKEHRRRATGSDHQKGPASASKDSFRNATCVRIAAPAVVPRREEIRRGEWRTTAFSKCRWHAACEWMKSPSFRFSSSLKDSGFKVALGHYK